VRFFREADHIREPIVSASWLGSIDVSNIIKNKEKSSRTKKNHQEQRKGSIQVPRVGIWATPWLDDGRHPT
jgi:hypothetical protein